MNIRITLALLICILFALISLSCREEPVEKPNLLSDIEAIPHPGGAVIHFTLAETEDLLEVVGEYTRANGELVTIKANLDQSTITVEGVGGTGKHMVRLIVLDPDHPDTPLEEAEVLFIPLPPHSGKCI